MKSSINNENINNDVKSNFNIKRININRKFRKKKFYSKRKLSLIVLGVVFLGVSLGYAYLSTTLNITGTAGINNVQWDIYFDNIEVTEGSVATENPAEITESKTGVSYSIFLSEPGDFYEFKVDAVNNGSLNGMIDDILFKLNDEDMSDLPEYLEYKISYSSGKDLEKDHLLKSFSSETYLIRIAFKKDITADMLPSTKQNLNFSFEVTYKQADKNGVEVIHPSK